MNNSPINVDVSVGTFWLTLFIFIYIFFQPNIVMIDSNTYMMKYIGHNPYICDIQNQMIFCKNYKLEFERKENDKENSNEGRP